MTACWRDRHVAASTSISDSIMTAKNSSFIYPLAVVWSSRLGRRAPLRLCLAASRAVRRRSNGKQIKPRLAAFDVQSIVELQSDA